MQISILGCGGSRGQGSKTTAFLIDGSLLLDVGTATETLDPGQCAGIDNILLTHAHIDHICDLPFFVEAIYDLRNKPTTLYAIKEVIEDVSSHILNGRIWPDFSRIPSPQEARLHYKVIKPFKSMEVGSYGVLPIPVNHTVPTVGYLIDDGKTALAFTADTCITGTFWDMIRKEERLRAVIAEASFPNRLERLARMTGHLTPNLLAQEVKKMSRSDVQVLATHIKPFCREEVVAELRGLSETLPINILEDGMQINLL